MVEITKCEVCGNKTLTSVLNLGLHPLCDDLVPQNSTRTCKEYPIEILYCNNCYTGHQKFQVEKSELFPQDYHYRARMTPSVLKFMSELVNSAETKYGSLNSKLVLDIGCNDGSLLNFFKAKGAKTIGVDPTGAAKDAISNGHEILEGFFDKDIAINILEKFGKPDFITFTNVFAHIEDLEGLIEALNFLISDNTTLIIENHYLGSILIGGQFDTFYHEHPRTYSLKSFEFIAKSLGLDLVHVEFPSRYGGNIRAWIGHKDMGESKLPIIDESIFYDKFIKMRDDIDLWKINTRKIIDDYVIKNGKLRAKAFPGRAAILIKLLNLNENQISAVYEIKGSIKTGNYVPGTRIPILPEADLYKMSLDEPILNLAWHIPKEVRENLLKNGYIGTVIDNKN